MKKINSTFLTLSKNDAVKAFFLFLTTTIVTIVGDAIMQEINNGVYSLSAIHWKEIGLTILSAVIGYLKVKFLTNSEGDFLKKEGKS